MDAVVGSSNVGNVDPCWSVDGEKSFEGSEYALVGQEGTVRFHSELSCLEHEKFGPFVGGLGKPRCTQGSMCKQFGRRLRGGRWV